MKKPLFVAIALALSLSTFALSPASIGAAAQSNDVTPAQATAQAGSDTWITVASPFTGDGNNNSYTAYEYSTSSTGPWTAGCGNGVPGDSAWRICTVTGLTANTDYWVRVTFVDPDGVNGPSPQILGPVHTQATSTPGVAVGTASASVQDTSILVTVPISGDSNLNSRLVVGIGTSSSGPWTQKCGDDGFHSPKLCRIHGLVQNTDYWVQATVSDPDGVSGTNPRVLGPLHYTGLTDLAVGKAISADPGWGCCPNPNQLVDGQVQYPSWTYGFAWTGGTAGWGGGAPGWKQATIDLGSPQQIARLDFWPHHPGHVVTDWKVLVSQDGNSFTEVFSTTQPQCRTATLELESNWGYPACAQIARFSPVSARYVRYTFDDRTTFGGLHGWGQEIEVFGPVTTTVTALSGWNMVGGSPLTLWTDSSVNWSWNASTGQWYHPTGTEPAGTGAWEYVSGGAHTVAVQQCSVAISVSVVAHRWNMVGNACSTPVTVPSTARAYLWNGSTYVLTTTIPAGQAAWVKPTSSSLSLTP